MKLLLITILLIQFNALGQLYAANNNSQNTGSTANAVHPANTQPAAPAPTPSQVILGNQPDLKGLSPSVSEGVSPGLPAPAPTPDTSLVPIFEPTIRSHEFVLDKATQQRWKKLVPNLETKLKSATNDAARKDAHFNLGKAYFYMGDYDSAATHFKSSLDYNNPPSYFMLAETNYRNRKYLDSIRVMTDLSKKFEKNPKIFTQMGLAYQQSNRPDDAILNFKKAIEVNVKYEEAYRALVDLYSQQKMYTDARSTLEDMTRIFPKSPYVAAELCRIYLVDSYLKGAVEHCTAATDLDAQNPKNHAFLGLAYRDSENPKQAEKILKNAAKNFQKSEFVQWSTGSFFESKKDWLEATKHYTNCTKAVAKSTRCWLGLAKTSFEVAQFDVSLKAFSEACKLDRTTINEFRKRASTLRIQNESQWQVKFERGIDICR